MTNFKYCPNCKKNLVKKNECFYCQSCRTKIYLNPAPVVSVLPIKNGKVLLGKRNIAPYKGELDTIGGFMQIKESAEETAKREFLEETGVKISKLEYLGSAWGTYEPGEYTTGLNYIVRLNKEKLKAQDDISSLVWIPINKAHLVKSSFRVVKETLKDLQKWYKERK